MAGAFCAAQSTKRDSHARWLHCLVRLSSYFQVFYLRDLLFDVRLSGFFRLHEIGRSLNNIRHRGFSINRSLEHFARAGGVHLVRRKDDINVTKAAGNLLNPVLVFHMWWEIGSFCFLPNSLIESHAAFYL